MLGLSLNIWTDVRGITKNSGSVVSAVPVSSVVTVANSAFGIKANIIHNSLSQVNTIANVNIVKHRVKR